MKIPGERDENKVILGDENEKKTTWLAVGVTVIPQ